MTNSLATEARYVRCPKCLQLLQESADIPIYRCGGCDLILQAKYPKIVGEDLQKSNELPHKESNDASRDRDPGDLNHGLQIPSSAEHSMEFNDKGDQITSADAEHFTSKEDVYMCENGDHSQSKSEDNAELDEESGGTRSSTELDSHENEGLLPSNEGDSERPASKGSSPVPEDNFTQEANSIDLEVKKIIALVSSSGIHCVEEPKEKITAPNAPTVTHEERSKRTLPRAYGRRMSMETTTCTEYVDPVSDFSGTFPGTPRSPSRILHRHRDDFSGTPEMNRLNHYGKQANSTITRGRFSENKYRMNYDSEIRYAEFDPRPKLSSSREGDFIRARGRVRNGMAEPPTRASERRYRRRSEIGELPPRIPANYSLQRHYYDSGGPSNQVPGYSRFSSSIPSNDVPTYPEQEKMKLLRMVHELEYQLKRTCNLEGMLSERMPVGSHRREKTGDFYYSRDRMDEEDYLRGGLPVCSHIDKKFNRRRHHSRYPKRAFSAEAFERSRQHNNSYCHPFDWRRSEPFPPPPAGHRRNLYGIRNERRFYGQYSSCPSSPQHYLYDTSSNDEIYDKAREYEKYREVYQPTKKHIMPAAGGAPWIICSRCSRLVQLPPDFLLFKKRCHQLRCGSCSSILKFSLQNRRQLVPFVRRTEAPPPSEADGRGESLGDNNLPLGSRGNDLALSYSDDFGISRSTEGDPTCLVIPQSVGYTLR